MTTTRQLTSSSLPTSSKVLCAVYGLIAVVALAATWSQNAAYAHGGPARFLSDLKGLPASRSLSCDMLFFFLAAAIFMVTEARKRNIRFVWAYILAGLVIAISAAFPVFLIARELRMGASDGPRLRVVDTILLAALSIATVALAISVDFG